MTEKPQELPRLTSEQEVVELMLSSQNEQEWNDNCDRVKKDFDGYPIFWYKAILVSGLINTLRQRWNLNSQPKPQSGPTVIEGQLGQSITSFILDLAVRHRDNPRLQIIGKCNGVELIVNPDSKIDPFNVGAVQYQLMKSYEKQSKIQEAAYASSPEGIRAATAAAERKVNMQNRTNELIESLDSLDFSDLESVLDWICDFKEASDHTGLNYNKEALVSKFESNGFYSDANAEEHFNGEDPENVAKYIVGQALDGIIFAGSPNHLILEFTEQWKQKFGRKK